MFEQPRKFLEVLFYNSDLPDLHYTVWRLHKGERFTGITKLRIRRGQEPYVTHYCYNRKAYGTLEEVEAAFNRRGFVILPKRGKQRGGD